MYHPDEERARAWAIWLKALSHMSQPTGTNDRVGSQPGRNVPGWCGFGAGPQPVPDWHTS